MKDIWLIDKPLGWTSFAVLAWFRRLYDVKKVGHAGTLDPLATGLLLFCTNKATRRIAHLQGLPKLYTGLIRLGQTTPTFDQESLSSGLPRSCDGLSLDDIRLAMSSMLGVQEQVPPSFAAVKVRGRRAYSYARAGVDIEAELRAKVIHIFSFNITYLALPRLAFSLSCSKGTYVRRVAHDLGIRLGVGAYLYGLRRAAIGHYPVDKAYSLNHLLMHKNYAYT